MTLRALVAALLGLLMLAGCRTGRNYPDPSAPRYSGGDAAADGATGPSIPLRVVTFNVEHGREIGRAVALLRHDEDVRGADILLLQEMDAPSARAIADSLGMSWVYYPAMFRFATDRDFGNAILTRWPVAGDEKLVLPYRALVTSTQRIAVAATLCIAGRPVRVYSTHLGTVADLRPSERRSQLRAVLSDAAAWDRVIVGGDMNDGSVGEVALDAGFDWPTRRGPRTALLGRLDHVFTKGLAPAPGDAVETVLDNGGSSDHRPVRVDLLLHSPGDTARAGCP